MRPLVRGPPCETLVQDPRARHSCETLVQDPHARPSCETPRARPSCEAPRVRPSCKTLVRDTLSWLRQRLQADVGPVREALGTLDEAMTAARTQQQRLQQDLASLHDSLAELSRPCPRGWVPFGGSCYFFSATGRRRREAEGFCGARGSHLLIINSAAEQVLGRSSWCGYWLGLSDAEEEGSWRWQDGTPLGLSFWSSGEPSGGRQENCGTLLPDGRWNDLACDRPDYWVPWWASEPTSPPPPPPRAAPAELGGHPNRRPHHHRHHTQPLPSLVGVRTDVPTTATTRSPCRAWWASEPTPPPLLPPRAAPAELRWQRCPRGLPASTGLFALLAVAFVAWGLLLGLLLARYAALTREIQHLRESQGLLEANGSALVTELETLAGNQTRLQRRGTEVAALLETLSANQSLARMEVSRTMVAVWRDRDRTREELHQLLKALWEQQGLGCRVCPPGWRLHGGSCYTLGSGTASWAQAQSTCRESGAALATIGDSQEQAFVTSLGPRQDVWIGLHDRSTEGTFEWADGSPLNYQNWAWGQPDEAGAGEDCVAMGPHGSWADRACASALGAWLCERPWAC
ncbi:uncharacterized protein LOC134154819 [Rhea pennata]|uniref:uncharacterized protein LOC134154819 n=1 Tax=Rhea pennata TaxID=8795 RepID=UPI002E254F0B